jgi:pyruvate/2-oxoglutarate dehydrogenase complex dihydrolipoamide acyltransferase (E2) component
VGNWMVQPMVATAITRNVWTDTLGAQRNYAGWLWKPWGPEPADLLTKHLFARDPNPRANHTDSGAKNVYQKYYSTPTRTGFRHPVTLAWVHRMDRKPIDRNKRPSDAAGELRELWDGLYPRNVGFSRSDDRQLFELQAQVLALSQSAQSAQAEQQRDENREAQQQAEEEDAPATQERVEEITAETEAKRLVDELRSKLNDEVLQDAQAASATSAIDVEKRQRADQDAAAAAKDAAAAAAAGVRPRSDSEAADAVEQTAAKQQRTELPASQAADVVTVPGFRARLRYAVPERAHVVLLS